MSLSLDGSNDNVSLASTTFGDPRSILMWINPTSQGASDAGTVFSQGASASRAKLTWNGVAASKKLEFTSNRATDGVWVMTTGFTTLSEWHGLVLTYDGTSTTNDPILYVLDSGGFQTLAVGSGLTESSTPNGAEGGEGITFFVGSVSAAGSGLYAGLVGEVAVWDGVVLSAEQAAAALFLGALAVPGAPYLYWPMDDTGTAHATDFSGNARNGTLNNAPSVGANPPVRPAGRKG